MGRRTTFFDDLSREQTYPRAILIASLIKWKHPNFEIVFLTLTGYQQICYGNTAAVTHPFLVIHEIVFLATFEWLTYLERNRTGHLSILPSASSWSLFCDVVEIKLLSGDETPRPCSPHPSVLLRWRCSMRAVPCVAQFLLVEGIELGPLPVIVRVLPHKSRK